MLSHNTTNARDSKKKAQNVSQPTLCPICSHEYATRVVLKQGLHWQDMYDGTAFDFLTRYRRRCTAPIDVEAEDARQQLPRQETAVYFHGDTHKEPRA